MTYNAEIDTIKKINEKIVYKDVDITVITDDTSMQFLDGLSIDYSDDLIIAGFRFTNRNNEKSCGCGASFSLSGFPEPMTNEVSCE